MNILVVDDERDTRTVVRLALQQLGGFTVIEAASGPEALAAVSRVRPDAVVLDVMMPGMDGPAVLQALRAQPATADVPVIFLTAKAMPDEIARLRTLGALAIHTKPFEPETFALDVRAALTRERPGPDGETQAPVPAVEAPAPSDDEVDADALRRLRGLCTDTGDDLLGELIDLFASSTPRTLERLGALRMPAGVPADEVERLAHALRGSAATLGLTALAADARVMERLAREGRLTDTLPILDRVAARFPPALDRLRRERARLVNGTQA